MSKPLSRADFLAVKLPHVDVIVPEMGEGVTVRLQQMSVDTRSKFLERIRNHQNDVLAYEDDQEAPEEAREGLEKPADLDTPILALVNSIIDEDGNRLFTEEDIPFFNTMSTNAVTRLYKAAIALNDYDRFASEAVAAEKKRLRENGTRRFQFRLAALLGKTLGELEAMPYDEFVGWQAFYQLEPWGCYVEDHRASTSLDLLFAINSKPNTPIPTWFDRDPQTSVKPDPTPEELSEKVRDFFIGKTVKVAAPAAPEKKPRKPRKDKGAKRKPQTGKPPAK